MTRNPPLTVWISAALIVAVLLGVLQWAGDRLSREQEEALWQTQQERLHEYLSTGKSPRVVMMGTSLARAALPFKQLPGNPPLPWLHINQSGRDFTLFAHLSPTLLQHPPDVLIIQIEVLLPDGTAAMQQPLNSLRRNLKQLDQISTALKRAKPERIRLYRRQASALQERLVYYNPGHTWEEFYRTQIFINRFRFTGAVNPKMAQLLRELASRGTRIMLIDIPRSKSYESAFGADESFWLDGVKAPLMDIPGIRFLRLGPPLGDECYSDFAHLKPSCRKRLLPALIQLASDIRDLAHD